MKPLGSLNLQGFFVFRIVQFSRYQFVIFIDPLRSAAFLLYHIAYRLSRGFLNFFKVFWAPDSWYRSPLEAAYLAYHISFGLSSTFSKFLFLLSVWVVFPALLATYLFYHTCLPLSIPGCFKSIQYILPIFMHIIQSARERTRQTAGCASVGSILLSSVCRFPTLHGGVWADRWCGTDMCPEPAVSLQVFQGYRCIEISLACRNPDIPLCAYTVP